MAAAIFSACSMPLTLPSFFIEPPKPSISPINSLTVATASFEPKALASSSPSATFNVSPYLLLILVSMSTIGSISPCALTNSNPNCFCALPTPAKNALYFVPASLPDMVACNVPKIPICSFMPIPASVASAPIEVNALDILDPVVLNICTAVAVMPVTCSTQLLLPIPLACF